MKNFGEFLETLNEVLDAVNFDKEDHGIFDDKILSEKFKQLLNFIDLEDEEDMRIINLFYLLGMQVGVNTAFNLIFDEMVDVKIMLGETTSGNTPFLN